MSVEIVVEMGLDSIGEEVLEAVRKASEILLKRYGIKAYVIPSIRWGQPFSMPRIQVCGRVLELPLSPKVMEIVAYVLSLLPCTHHEEVPQLIHRSAERPLFKACA